MITDALKTALSGRYRIERELGAGGMATVYLAHDLKHDRQVALKILRPDLGAVLGQDRFLSEIKISAGLDHPHILTLIDSGVAEGFLFYVLPYVRGGTLRDKLAQETQLGIEESVTIAKQVASALEYAHRQGVVHRDIKPENIMFQEGEVMLADFGIALAVKEAGGNRLTETGLSLGTPQYMSPEQATGDRALDARSDIYSLGAVLYEMLTGEPPVTGATAQAMIAKLMTERPTMVRTIRSTVPVALDAAVAKSLAKIPADRYRGAAEFSAALDKALAPAGAGMSVPWKPILGGVGVGALALVGFFLIGGLGGDVPASAPTQLEPGRQVSFVGDVGTFAVAPDDRTVAYLTPDRVRVVLFDLDGGGSQVLYTAPSGTVLDALQWSPDGARLLLTAFPYNNRIFSVPRLGGATREELRLSNIFSLSGSRVRLLDNGTWLVVGRQNTLYLGSDPGAVRAVGTQLEGPGTFAIPGLSTTNEEFIRPSRDGAWLAYQGTTPDGQQVGGIAAVGAPDAVRVIAQWPDMVPIGWSAGARRLTMARTLGDNVVDVLQVAFDPGAGRVTGEPRLIYPRLAAKEVALSRDGSRIVYVAGTDVYNLREFTLDRTPTVEDNPSRMVTQGTGRWEVGLFHPDGGVIGVQRSQAGMEARHFDRDGATRPVVQRPHPGARFGNSVSTDGGTLASVEGQGTNFSLVLYDLASGRTRRIPLPEEPSFFAWSADDRFLAGMTATSSDKMLVVDVAAESARTVTLQCGTQCEFAWEAVAIGDRWPLVAITSEVDTWIANVETGELRHLADDTWYVIGWVGDRVYFIRAGGQTDYPGMALFRMRADGGTEERLLNLPVECELQHAATLSRDGSRVICSIDESRRDLYVISGVGVGG